MLRFERRTFSIVTCAAVGLLTSMMGPGSALADMAKLTQSQAIAHISGKTETWTKGGGYYAEDGSMQVVWKGKESAGSWQVKADGQVCMIIEAWGDSEECHEYVNEDGVVKLLFEGNARVAEIKDGNQVNSF